ncbi:RNaseH domain-containing protein [Streptomyces sp. NPDC047141]|uniref:RNaseH domain-containing protein n=1 Tax=Streptomyces sp. NPDC047141 TaxID=3155738 RepID=UPI0033EEB021
MGSGVERRCLVCHAKLSRFKFGITMRPLPTERDSHGHLAATPRHQRHRRPFRKQQAAPPVTLTFTAMLPANGTDGGPWQTWAWSPPSGRWQPYAQSTAQLHAADLGESPWKRSRSPRPPTTNSPQSDSNCRILAPTSSTWMEMLRSGSGPAFAICSWPASAPRK